MASQIIDWTFCRSSRTEVFLNILQNSQENICAGAYFFFLIAGWRSANLLERDCGIFIFLWIMQKFKEHLLCKTPSNGCFCLPIYEITSTKKNGMAFFKIRLVSLIFSSQFLFITSKLNLGIINCFFIFMRDKNINYSLESTLMLRNFSLFFSVCRE